MFILNHNSFPSLAPASSPDLILGCQNKSLKTNMQPVSFYLFFFKIELDSLEVRNTDLPVITD